MRVVRVKAKDNCKDGKGTNAKKKKNEFDDFDASFHKMATRL